MMVRTISRFHLQIDHASSDISTSDILMIMLPLEEQTLSFSHQGIS